MQAMSFAVHIPLVCFGIAFPAMVVFLEGLWLRTGDPLYRALARRWSKAMVILFAVGVVTGHDPVVRDGPAVARVHGDASATCSGSRSAIEGFSFFIEAIFIAIYVYGWDRLSPRTHLAVGRPDRPRRLHRLVHGDRGQRLDEPARPASRSANGEVTDVNPLAALFNIEPLARARPHVPGRLHRRRVPGRGASTPARWLRGRRDRYHRVGARGAAQRRGARRAGAAAGRRLGGARPSRSSQPVKLAAFEGLGETTEGRAAQSAAATTARGRRDPDPGLLSLLAFHDPNATVKGLDTVPPDDRPPVAIVQRSLPGDGRDRHARSRPSARGSSGAGGGAAPARVAVVLPRRWSRPGRCRVVALIAGWITTEVGRQPWIVYEVMRTARRGDRRRRDPGRVRDARRSSTLALGGDRVRDAAPARRASRLRGRAPRCWPTWPRVAHADRRADRVRRARRRRLRRRLLGPHRRRRRARRAGAGHDQARDGAGVGGEPRLADLRAGDAVDGVPGGVRLDHLDARGAAVPRRARHRAARRRVRAEGPGGDDRRGARARRDVRAVVGARAVLPRRRGGRASPSGQVPVGNAAGDAVAELDRHAPDLRRACSRWSPARTWPPCSSARTRSAWASPSSWTGSACARSAPAPWRARSRSWGS